MFGGTVGDRPAVAKLLHLTEGPYWSARFRHEIWIYRLMAGDAPPCRVPELLGADGESVLILERLPGEPVARGRHPSAPLSRATRTALFSAATSFGAWRPRRAGDLPRIFDYPARFERYHRVHGILSGSDHALLTRLFGGRCWSYVPQHGGLLPSNALRATDGSLALIDFEFCGRYLL